MTLRAILSPSLLVVLFAGQCLAQAPAAPPKPPVAPAKTAAPPVAQTPASLAQIMKGIFFINSNVIFAAQNDDPAKIAQDKDPSLAVNPLASTYGRWEAVENSGLAMAEAANLLMIPGRKCSNGVPVPLRNADWAQLVQGVREAGIKAYAAAKAKNQDAILDVADVMTTACSNCHDKYREKAKLEDRCK